MIQVKKRWDINVKCRKQKDKGRRGGVEEALKNRGAAGVDRVGMDVVAKDVMEEELHI